jgi:hypothetical protein
MSELIALAPAVAIDASMGTAPVYIHAVIPAFAGEYSLCVHKMHSSHSLQGGRQEETGDGSLSPEFSLGLETENRPLSPHDEVEGI